jgi:hypothetical protein
VKERSSSEVRLGREDGRDGGVEEKELFVRLDIAGAHGIVNGLLW